MYTLQPAHIRPTVITDIQRTQYLLTLLDIHVRVDVLKIQDVRWFFNPHTLLDASEQLFELIDELSP